MPHPRATNDPKCMRDVECVACKKRDEVIARLSQLASCEIKCEACGGQLQQIFVTPTGVDGHAAASWRR